MKQKLSAIYLSLILILAVLIVLNILFTRHFIRFDFTKDHEYTLSKATKTILSQLDAPVTIMVYFSKKVPANLALIRHQLISTLEDFKAYSHGKIVFKVLDPNKSQDIENQAMRDGIAPILVEVREKDQAKQQKAYMGLVVKYKDKKDVIQYIPPNSSLEYLLAKSIKKVTTQTKPIVGILQGFGTPSEPKMQAFIDELSTLYDVRPFNFDSTRYDLDKYKVIAIISPKEQLPDKLFGFLDKYLANGGRLFIADDAVVGHLNANPPMGNSNPTGIEKWLKKYGITIRQSFIIDNRCANIQIQQPNFPMPISVPFPYFPIISNFANHPITKGLEAVIMSFASPIEYKDTNGIKFQPLAYTSKLTGLEPPPVFFATFKKWTKADFPYHNLIVGLLAQSKTWKMIVFGDGDFLQFPRGERFQHSDNVSLAANSIDYLADDMGLMSLRTKGISYKPLKQLNDTTKAFIKYTNFLLPIILVILLGLFKAHLNNKKRKKLKNS